MRWGAILILSLCVLGCHQKKKPATQPVSVSGTPANPASDRASGALAFTPPVARGERELQLWRDGRELTAFGGYDQTIAQYYYIRTDDRQNIWGDNDTVMRRAVNVRIGISTR